MPQGKTLDTETVSLENLRRRGGVRDFFDDDLVVYKHIEDLSAQLNELLNLGRPYDVEGFIPVDLAREHEDSGKTRDVVRMGVGDEDARNFLPPEVETAQGNLGSLAAIEEKELAFPAEQNRC
jgi:hypothetical protein